MKHLYSSVSSVPAPGAISRRMLLQCSTIVLGGVIVERPSRAQSAIPDHAPVSRFMALSALLIAHRLDPEIGRRIAVEMKADQPPLSDHIDALLKLARSKNATDVEGLFPFADEATQASALRIISAWYLGVVDNVPGAEVIAYELALMFQPTSDVMTIPTYAISGPNGWTSKSPVLGAMPIF